LELVRHDGSFAGCLAGEKWADEGSEGFGLLDKFCSGSSPQWDLEVIDAHLDELQE
jgi:hypothetical protein